MVLQNVYTFETKMYVSFFFCSKEFKGCQIYMYKKPPDSYVNKLGKSQ